MKIWLNYIPTCGDELLKKKKFNLSHHKGYTINKIGAFIFRGVGFSNIE